MECSVLSIIFEKWYFNWQVINGSLKFARQKLKIRWSSLFWRCDQISITCALFTNGWLLLLQIHKMKTNRLRFTWIYFPQIPHGRALQCKWWILVISFTLLARKQICIDVVSTPQRNSRKPIHSLFEQIPSLLHAIGNIFLWEGFSFHPLVF